MIEITTKEEFYELIKVENVFKNISFNLPNLNLSVTKKNISNNWIKFESCSITCSMLEFKNIKNDQQEIIFEDCEFNCELIFSNCTLDKLQFENTKKIVHLDIRKGKDKSDSFEINQLKFFNSKDEKLELNGTFYIGNITVKKKFLFEKIDMTAGKFEFIDNTLGVDDFNDGIFSFKESRFINADFKYNDFKELVSFENSIFKNDSREISVEFYDNTFFKASFSESHFYGLVKFDLCDFLGTSWFEDCIQESGTLRFIACKFEKYSLFDNSSLDTMEIQHSKFQEKASFENIKANDFTIHQVTFAESAFFDDIKIKNIDNCTRKTIRTIKQELLKTDNKIDYNRFRVYEFNAYKKDIPKKLNEFKDDKQRFFYRKREPIQLKRDLIILQLSDLVSEYGTDWKRALKFTLLSGLFFYSSFFFLELYFEDFYKYQFSNNYFGDFFKGFFRFFLLTDFYNPLEDGKTYIQSVWSWIPFILGKIFIAFGIYEMIQSFRKFKA